MRITFERTGGFAGLRTRKSIDTSKLPPEDAAEVHQLVHQAGFFNLPPRIDQPDLRDAFQYNISVDSGDQQHSVSITGEPADPKLRQLKKKLESLKAA